MQWIEQKYIGLISSRLGLFKHTQNNVYNFRCPYCGDSAKNKTKTRGYLYPRSGAYQYHCHNCGITTNIDRFIEHVDSNLYNDYVREKIENKFTSGNARVLTDVEVFANKMKKPVFMNSKALNRLPKISSLEPTHPAVQYVKSRMIPNKYHYKIFYVSKFKKYVNSLISEKYNDITHDESRIIIPFLDEDKAVFGFQGRSLGDSSLRYVTIMLDANRSKVFGLDTCEREREHYILEGPIDSMFVSNAIAMAGNTIDWSLVNKNSVFVYDNEPRNRDICNKIEQAILKGHSVVIFPNSIRSKDINDMVLHERVNVDTILKNNTYNGLQANLVFNNWRRV